MKPKLFIAIKAFIAFNGKILILRESTKYQDGSNVGKFDVAGGRIKPGQRFDESLRREVKEETGLEVVIGSPFFVNEWRPTVNNQQWQIVGIFFKCVAKTGEIILGRDHDRYLWIEPQKYKGFDLIENLFPAFEAYLQVTI